MFIELLVVCYKSPRIKTPVNANPAVTIFLISPSLRFKIKYSTRIIMNICELFIVSTRPTSPPTVYAKKVNKLYKK